MTTPCIITVAITGSLPRKKDNPAVPITVAEQVESTHAAFDAGDGRRGAATAVAAGRRDDSLPPAGSGNCGRRRSSMRCEAGAASIPS